MPHPPMPRSLPTCGSVADLPTAILYRRVPREHIESNAAALTDALTDTLGSMRRTQVQVDYRVLGTPTLVSIRAIMRPFAREVGWSDAELRDVVDVLHAQPGDAIVIVRAQLSPHAGAPPRPVDQPAPTHRVVGTGVHYRTGDMRGALLVKTPGRHRPIALVCYALSLDDAARGFVPGESVHLDMENAIQVSIGCIDCEEQLTDVTVMGRCEAPADEVTRNDARYEVR